MNNRKKYNKESIKRWKISTISMVFIFLKIYFEEKFGKKKVQIPIRIKKKKRFIDLKEFLNKVKSGNTDDGDIKILEKLFQKLYKLHKKNKRKVVAFCFSTVVVAVTVGLITSFIFPTVFKSNAASYTWVQTDWSGGANVTTTGHPAPANWDKFEESTNIDYSVGGEIQLSKGEGSLSETFSANTYKDTNNTTANWNTTSGRIEFPSESMGTDLREKLNGILGYDIRSQVIIGDELYIGADGGKFIKYNKSTDAVTDLTDKIFSFWSTNDIRSLVVDSTNNVIYLVGYGGKFARYNTISYAGGGTYPTADTAYDLTSKISSFWFTTDIYSLSFDSVNNVIYLGGASGKFARYNTTSYTGGGTYSTANTAYNLNSKIASLGSIYIESFLLDSSNNVLYLGSSDGKFARYNTISYTGGGTYPTADTAYDLTSKISSFWSTNYVFSLIFDSTHDVMYLGGQNGKFARYNTTSYTGGGTYPIADTAYDLTSKISSFWSTHYIYYFAFDSSNDVVYLGGQSGGFARYNTTSYTAGGTYPTADTAYDLTSKISSFWGTSSYVSSLIFDSANDVTYLGGVGGRFARYNTTSYTGGGTYPTADTAYDLTNLATEFWIKNTIRAIEYGANNEIYIGGWDGKFAKYNTETEVVTDLTSKISSFFSTSPIYSLYFDSANNVIYLAGGSGKFARYNTTSYAGGGTYPTADTAYDLTSKISSFWSFNYVNYLYFDSTNNVIYLGGGVGKFARYNTDLYTGGGTYPTANTAYDLTSKISSFWSTNSLNSLSFDSANNAIYLGGQSGKFARYNTTSYAGGGTYPTADTAYDLTSKISSFWSTSSVSFTFFDSINSAIYLGGQDGKFGRYNIASDTATNLRSPDTISFWGTSAYIYSFCINPDTEKLYLGGTYGNFAEKPPIYSPSYAQSLTFDSVSANIMYATLTKTDSGGGITYYLSNNGGLDWTAVTPGEEVLFATSGSDLRFKIGVISGTTVQDVNISYWGYNSQGNLVSSAYNTLDFVNDMAKIEWTENIETGTDVKFQIRTASTGGGLSSADWMGPTGTGDYYTNPLGTETINSEHTDASNDQWFQYQVFLTSDGINTPTLSDTTLTYVSNVSPEVQNVTATQNADGTVTISYEVKDVDTITGTNTPNEVTPSFEYWNGSAYVPCTTMAAGDTDNKAVLEGSFSSCTATWTAAIDFDGNFMNNTAKIRVTVDDNELANSSVSAESATYTLDTKEPAQTEFSVDATTTPPTLTLTATDDSSFEMKISLLSDLSDASWASYQETSNITLSSNPDTVYAQLKDAFSNETSILNTTIPPSPQNIIIRDVTNLDTSDYQLFIAWEESALGVSDFKQYNVYKSDDGETYTLAAILTDKTINYYMSQSLSEGTTYYYKVTTEDNDNNISPYSDIVSDTPNGQGGTDTTSPANSNVASASITATQATITWATDELSDSLVGYSTTQGVFTSETQVNTMTTSHSVVLTGLTPNTTYYFQVQSTDPSSNTGTDNDTGDGYSFTTTQGAVITAGSVTTTEVKNTTATVEWTTDIASDSYVVYSVNSNMSGSMQMGNATLTTSHSVTITELTQGTKYYYYVKSTDGESNLAVDNNGGDYYYFTTTSDSSAPTITNLTTTSIMDTSAVIEWTTDEGATTQVEYGTASGVYTITTTENTNLNINHAVTLENLTADMTYYYRAISKDGSDNQATSNEATFTTLETLSEESEVTAATSGGGGIIVIDKTDKIAPEISDIKMADIKSDSATILWTTNENANSFVQYNSANDSDYQTSGIFDNVTKHSVTLKKLDSDTKYYYTVLSVDGWGNLAKDANHSFTTISKAPEDMTLEEVMEQLETPAPEPEPEGESENGNSLEKNSTEKEGIFLSAAQQVLDIIEKTASQVSIGVLESTLAKQYEAILKISKIIPPPLMSSEPLVAVTSNNATISWTTDKDTNSMVAFSSNSSYDADAENPYKQMAGNSKESTKNHSVVINDLTPDTIYHYQVTSKASVGPEAKSKDFTFKTNSEILEIVNYTVQTISHQEAIFRWTTNLDTDATVTYIPYKNNIPDIEGVKSKNMDIFSLNHEITVDDFLSGVVYDIELAGKDKKGRTITKEIKAFKTGRDELAPEIYQIQTDSAISPGDEVKAQTIISWLTYEPSTTRIYYDEGVGTDLGKFNFKTLLDENYTKKHVVVITKFEPGKVYRFKAESIDYSGNVGMSKLFSVLVPRQKESVFQIIMKTMEKTFGWVKKI